MSKTYEKSKIEFADFLKFKDYNWKRKERLKY